MKLYKPISLKKIKLLACFSNLLLLRVDSRDIEKCLVERV